MSKPLIGELLAFDIFNKILKKHCFTNRYNHCSANTININRKGQS
jgi:hypothetical protein